MKKHFRRISPLLLPMFTSVLLVSCVTPVYQEDACRSSGSAMVYTTLPGNYYGDAYYYNGRYYSGGRYETGRYQDRGRSYGNRYYYKGQYYYGGTYKNHARGESRQEERRDGDRSGYRNAPSSQRTNSRQEVRSGEGSSRYSPMRPSGHSW